MTQAFLLAFKLLVELYTLIKLSATARKNREQYLRDFGTGSTSVQQPGVRKGESESKICKLEGFISSII
jgi:hypothetical protein